MRPLTKLRIKNFLSFDEVDVPLADLNALVGPNGSGKTNFLSAIRFLGKMARNDLGPTIDEFGGIDRLRFRGGKNRDHFVELHIEGHFTPNASKTAKDEYTLRFMKLKLKDDIRSVVARQEEFAFKRVKGRGRRISISKDSVRFSDETAKGAGGGNPLQISLGEGSSGLSTLRRLGRKQESEQVDALASLLEELRVFDVDVEAARRPSPLLHARTLSASAFNVAPYLIWLRQNHEEIFNAIVEDMAEVLPGFQGIEFVQVGGSTEAVALELKEKGLRGRTPLAAASFGTIRSLALFAMLHDPDPPKLSCIEEIDHGLHPYALDRIVERLRQASQRTQIIIATHSPALVNRLRPEELIVCERDTATGATRMPAIDPATIHNMVEVSDLRLGELWFSGSLGGVP